MSWRPSGGGDFKKSSPQKSSPQKRSPSPTGNGGSGKSNGPQLLDPTLQALIIAAVVVGLVGLGLAVALGGTLGQGGTQTASQPTAAPARPTAAPVATAAPAATEAAATAATSAPTTGGGIPTEPIGPALASGSGTAITLNSDGDLLAFDQPNLSVANGLVTLTFNNTATAVQHNWVLVEGDDTAVNTVNDAAQAQVRVTRDAAGAVPPADTPGLLVALPMLNAGDSTTVTFQTPGPGTYQFICTFPGHYLAGMKGTLVVN